MQDLSREEELANRVEVLEAHKVMLETNIDHYRARALELEALLKKTKLFDHLSQMEATSTFSEADVVHVTTLIEKGAHMELFEEVSKENPILMDAWKRFMVTLRLTGMDGTV